MSLSKFYPGQRVRKVGGSYQAIGTVVSAFMPNDDSFEWRYVFRFDEPKGMLHIFNGNQLEAFNTAPAANDSTVD